jgi:hypothetical protein
MSECMRECLEHVVPVCLHVRCMNVVRSGNGAHSHLAYLLINTIISLLQMLKSMFVADFMILTDVKFFKCLSLSYF